MTTLQDALQIIRSIKRSRSQKSKKRSIADELLGKYRGVIPKGQSSSQYLRELRSSLYGKIK